MPRLARSARQRPLGHAGPGEGGGNARAEEPPPLQQAYGALLNRIKVFTALPFASLDRISLQKAVDDIGSASTTTAGMSVYALNGLGRIGNCT